jgi:heme oxygenase
LADFQELWKKEDMPELAPSTEKYIQHMATIKEDPKKLMAHIYVRHMGDLSGGQMIKKRAPGSGTMYEFGRADIKEIKERIRNKTDDSMADEAKLCFQSATELFKDLHNAEEKK